MTKTADIESERTYFITSDKDHTIRIFKNYPIRVASTDSIGCDKDTWHDFSRENDCLPSSGLILNNPYELKKYERLTFDDEPVRLTLGRDDQFINNILTCNYLNKRKESVFYVARNLDGRLRMFRARPCRNICNEWIDTFNHESLSLDPQMYPEIDWSNEPMEVNLAPKDPYRIGHCHHCDRMFKFMYSNIGTSFNFQPSSTYEDDGQKYVTCPYCGGYIPL